MIQTMQDNQLSTGGSEQGLAAIFNVADTLKREQETSEKKPVKRQRSSKSKMFQGMQEEMTFPEKMNYLNQLPDHKMAQGSKGDRYFDIGTHRPWGMESIRFLVDMMRENASPMDIAFLSRRSYHDVLAMYRIFKWVINEDSQERRLRLKKKLNQEKVREG